MTSHEHDAAAARGHRVAAAGSRGTEAFATVIGYLAARQAQLVPSPDEVVTATVTSAQIADRLREAGCLPEGTGGDAELLARIRLLLEHEPFLFGAAYQPGPSEPWTAHVPAVLRRYQDVTSVGEYIDTVTALVTPADPRSVPPSVGALDIPYAIGYLDAVWQARTGRHLFTSLDPASVTRLTLACGSEEQFNSLMSALADVPGQVTAPGTAVPPQRGALEAVRDYLARALAPEAADRVSSAFEALIRLRRIRVSTQHADARHRAVTSFAEIGLAFPPPSWDQAWAHIATLAAGALDAYAKKHTPASASPQPTEAADRDTQPTGPASCRSLSDRAGSAELVVPGPLPAGITNRVGHCLPTPGYG